MTYLAGLREGRSFVAAGWLCCSLVAAASCIPLDASAQMCRGNPDVGCTSAGARCSRCRRTGRTLHDAARFPARRAGVRLRGSPAPPVTIQPKYIVGGLVYAPPGCTNPTAGSACSQPGSVDYSGSSSLGTKITTANSFKNGLKVTASLRDSDVIGSSDSFAWSRTTTGDSHSANLTKSSGLEIKAFGNKDGIDHDQDMFILLLNPTVTLSSDGAQNIYGNPVTRETPQPATRCMSPSCAILRRCALMSPLCCRHTDSRLLTTRHSVPGPVQWARRYGTIGTQADFCQVSASTGAPSPGLDLNRFRPTTWILPYEPPLHASDLCPTVTATLKNDFASEDASSTEDDYTVSADMHAGVKDTFGLKMEGEMTWTNSETDANSRGSTQSASLTLVCPSVGYTGPTLFQVYWDVMYGTFLLIPFDLASMEIIQHGTVTDAHGKPVGGKSVELEYGGRNYHTFTTTVGTYRFATLKGLLRPNLRPGAVTLFATGGSAWLCAPAPQVPSECSNTNYSLSCCFSVSLTSAGLPLPAIAFITWPTKKPNSFSRPPCIPPPCRHSPPAPCPPRHRSRRCR